MNKTNIVFRAARWAAVGAALAWAGGAQGARPTGESVVAAMTGQAQVRVLSGPVHEGKTDLKDLFEGAAMGEGAVVQTGKDGRLCLACSPGAIVCVAPGTKFEIRQLRHAADGLPQSEDDLIRRIHLKLVRGRLLVNAGEALPTMDVRIETPAGAVLSSGGIFAVAEDGQDAWHVWSETGDLTLVPNGGDPVALAAGAAARFAGTGAEDENVDANAALFQFELCEAFFGDLEPFVHRNREFDRAGLGQYLGLTEPIAAVDAGALVTDASPSIRPAVAGTLPARLPRPGAGEPGGRWEEPRIWQWYESLGPVKGVNYVPRTAVNSVEMWQADTFDADAIDEELGWAQDAGYTCIRVQLQFAVWQADPDGFLDRMDRLLELAAKHGLRVVPVLFDDLNLAGQPPTLGAQPPPVPGEHNARWVPSPAATDVADRDRWPELERYVKAVLGQFKRDGRVLYWDLYNTAGNSGLGEATLPLLDQTFNWARAEETSQPLAVPAWRDFGSAMATRKLERSDLVTFHSFEGAAGIEARIQLLKRFHRPIICSDWLLRQAGADFEKVLPVFAANRVGWFNRGLVAGKTQLQVQQPQFRSAEKPDLWQQNVLQEDGQPYDEREIELIRGFRYLEISNQ